MNETIAYLPGLSSVAGKDVRARFDGGRLSSDGGVVLLREIEGDLAIADRLSSCVNDARDPAITRHTDADMIRARSSYTGELCLRKINVVRFSQAC